jgi:hypothetical protein
MNEAGGKRLDVFTAVKLRNYGRVTPPEINQMKKQKN